MLKRLSLLLICCSIAACAASAQDKKSAGKAPAPTAKASVAATPFLIPPRAAGNKNAAVVIEVFSDFQCPGCRQYYLSTLRRVVEDYCLPGKVYLIHHDFPLPQHPYSKMAARWGVASALVGKYEAVMQALFEKQDVWGASGNIEAVLKPVFTPDELAKVKAALLEHLPVIDAEIERDVALGKDVKVQETPSTRVTKNGKEVAPLTPRVIEFNIMKRFLDDQLK